MPVPTTVAEFLDLVRKSGVLEDKRLDAHVDRLRAVNDLPAEATALARNLVRDGVLTNFQAEQLLLGKWRRFHIGKYKVLERLASGGMGSVYLCEHKLMRRRVAVKVLPSAKADDPSSLERFYREARAVAALDHPNIVRAYDIDQDDKLHFLVMEYVDGSSLQEIIRKTGQMDYIRTTHYIAQAAMGLQHAHETAGLVHRDIKPGNILVDRSGVVKILDMGLARFFHDEEDILTKKYDENVLGTADYLAPEQALDSHSVDIRADIYSLGNTFYYCLTGRAPFAEGTVAQKLIWHQTRQPKAVSSTRTDVPDDLLAVMDKMMAKDPAQRYQTPLEVAEALLPWTQIAIPPPPEVEMPRLSLAAQGASYMETGGPLSSVPAASVPLSSSSQKNWQLPAGPASRPPSSQVPTVAASAGSAAPSAANMRKTAVTPVSAPRPGARPAARPPAPPAAPPERKPTLTPAAAAGGPPAAARNSGPQKVAAPRPAPASEPAPDEDVAPWEDRPAPDTEDPSARVDTDPKSAARKAPARKRQTGLARPPQPPPGKPLWLKITLIAGPIVIGLAGLIFLMTR